jgi:acetyltransferase-like isoleucine patch superfamily enzyme
VIGDDVWLGTRVFVGAGVEIGAGCVVSAGSVVTRSLAPGSIAAGSPARVVRRREDYAVLAERPDEPAAVPSVSAAHES